MSRVLLPISGYTINPATEIASPVVGICEFLEIDLPTGTLRLTSHNRPITWGGNTYQPFTGTGAPSGVMGNYNEGTDGVPRPMGLTLSGVDPTLIGDLVSNDVQWVNITWSLGLLDSSYNLLNGTPVFSTPMYLGDCTVTLGEKSGSITINAENLLADLQNRTSGCLQTVEDQQQRGTSGNTTFSADTFFEFVASLTYVYTYWGMSPPFQIGVYGGIKDPTPSHLFMLF